MFWRTFAFTWLAYFGFYLCRKNFSVLMPYLKSEAGLSSGDLANALFGYSLAYALGQVAMGRLADRIGARWAAGFGMFVSASMSALMAFPLWIGSAAMLMVLQTVNGAAQSSGWPSVLKLSRDWFPTHNRGVTLAWWSTHLVVGGFAGTWLATRAASVDWTRGAWVPAIALCVIAIPFLTLIRDGTSRNRNRTDRPSPGKLAMTPALLALSAMYFCVKMTRYAFLFWLPLYMTEHLGYTNTQAGYASSAYELVGFLGVLAAGYVSERRNMSRFGVASFMMFLLSLLCLVYPAISASGYWPNLIMIALIGAFTFGPDTLMAAAGLQEVVPPESTGTAAGFVNGVGSAGQILSPYAVALVSSRAGWASLFVLLAAVVLVGAVVLASQIRRSVEEAQQVRNLEVVA